MRLIGLQPEMMIDKSYDHILVNFAREHQSRQHIKHEVGISSKVEHTVPLILERDHNPQRISQFNSYNRTINHHIIDYSFKASTFIQSYANAHK